MVKSLHSAFKAVLLCIGAMAGFCFSASAQIIITTAGGIPGYSGDGGAAIDAGMDSVTSIAFGAGALYINDQHRHSVRKVSYTGGISRIAGTGATGYGGDGGSGALARMADNWGVAADNLGNVYVADQGNHRVRKISPSGIITTIAGNGTAGFSGDGGLAIAAQLNTPIGVATDNSGNVYIGDSYNRRIRKVAPDGTISTVAGNGTFGFSGDGGPATYAQLSSYTYGLATDAAGNLYICDGYNHRIRKVTPAGIITTVAGNGSADYSGDGGPATAAALKLPTGVYVNQAGELFIADCRNNRVRKVSISGIISTVAGTGVAGYGGDGVLAVTAPLNAPLSVTGDDQDNLLIADSRNYRIRKIIKPLTFKNGRYQDIEVCENGTKSLNEELAVQDYSTGSANSWTIAMAPLHGYAEVTYSATSFGGVIMPSGLYYTPTPGFSGEDSFKVKVANATGEDLTTIRVKVNPVIATAGVIAGPTDVCLGSMVTLTAAIPGGTWSCSNLNVELISTGAECKVAGKLHGLSDVYYTLTNGCGAVSTVHSMAVNPLPVTGTITGADAVCVGSTVTLSATVHGGIWNSSTGKSVVTSGVVTGVAAGGDLIRYTTFNAWCQATVTHIINVEVFPDAGHINGPSELCAGTTATLSNSATNGSWNSGSAFASVAAILPSVPARAVVTGLAAGIAAVSYSVTNSCGTATAAYTVPVLPAPAEPKVDVNKLGLFSVSDRYDAYQWVRNGAIVPGAVADTFYAKDPGLYTVIVSNAFGCRAVSAPVPYNGCNPDDILLFPNPSASVVHVLWCRQVGVRLLTMDGRVVYYAGAASELPMAHLPPAVYMVELTDEHGKVIKTKRVVRLAGQ